MTFYQYSRWDGTQQVFDLDHDQLFEQISDDILSHGDVMRALRGLFRRGIPRSPQAQRLEGLRELLERLKARREEQLRRYNLDSVMKDLKGRLNQVVETERKGIERRLREARQRVEQAHGQEAEELQGPMKLLEERAVRSKEFLDTLPKSMAGAIKELSDYEFMDSEAHRVFQELLDMLKQRMLENYFRDMKQQLKDMSPEQMQRLRDVLKALNQMLQQRMRGQEPDFGRFMQQYGHLFGPTPLRTLTNCLNDSRAR